MTAYLFLPSTSTPLPDRDLLPWNVSPDGPLQSGYRDLLRVPHVPQVPRHGRPRRVVPGVQGTFERGLSPEPGGAAPSAGTRASAERFAQWVKDFRRCIDYLETRPEIDSRKLAYYGMSWGGDLGATIPAVEGRLKVSAFWRGEMNSSERRPEVSTINYVTRVRIPTLMLNGKCDNIIDSHIRPTFDLLGTPQEHKRLILYDTDHIPPRSNASRDAGLAGQISGAGALNPSQT